MVFTRFLPSKLLSRFSRVQLCDPIDSSPPGSPVPGSLQARTVEWVAISFSNAWKWEVKVKSLSRVLLLATPWTAAHQAPPIMGFSSREYWSGVPLPSPKDTLYYLLLFPYCTPWICFCSQSHLRGEELCFRFFRVETNLKSHKWFELCLQGRFVYSPLSIYLITYLHQYGLMDIYSVLQVIIRYYFILLLKLFQSWPLGSLSVGFCIPWHTPSIISLLSWHGRILPAHLVSFFP